MRLADRNAEVSVDDAVCASVSYDQLRTGADGLYWLETRPEAGGGATVTRWRPGEGKRDVSPEGFDISSGVHAYGGGSFAVIEGTLWCVGGDGLYRSRRHSEELDLVSRGSFGDLTIGDGELLAVRESEQGDELVAVSLTGAPQMRTLAVSRGFLGAPRPGPESLAWTAWSERDMPWDACEVWVASYSRRGQVEGPVKLAGGPDESAVEPRWGPDGALYFVSDRSGWWNLYRWDGLKVEAVAPIAGECAAEPWELGYASYGFLDDGRIVVAVQEGPRHRLVVIEPGGTVRPVDLPYTSIKPYLAVRGRTVALIGSSPTAAPQVALVHLAGADPQVEVLARSEHAALDGARVSTPTELRVRVASDREVLALVYPPTGSAADWRAPVIVRAHPGPTASCLLRLDWQTQFFTSRGFAVVDVDYLGSTGYGRAFRESLYGRWGLDDVDDCAAVAVHLLSTGRAAPGQVFIRGASAGGYTALHAVAQDGPFAAATAVSAIVDPDRWAETVPRFQRAHAMRLRGGAGRVRAAAVQRPVLLIHGTADEVAVVEDVRELADELTSLGMAPEVLLLPDVGHYVAASRRAGAALEAELAHYRSVMADAANGHGGYTAASGSR
ncbi:Dipeptidyl aminopeptidase/acylaminoacyl peptidase [Micromonospora purpureochromogenes]|uniref:Dipeptidyl aminopeptidase/acylaminoacyl peptidase n=1 Tax=Micromonospora purpureochromogenes TaxID=47872 RepID=A0A1C4UBZ1_9ACTN|nr:prolyl oligopeptidase family serine peptidase [Micromonospora purpureochromogenes]SCE69215.1 Dipeptidyl aminopeptidase/acylaminoacyl peptidase [Micromonospora purpureochromogenes]